MTAVIAVGALVSFAGPDIRGGRSASPADKTAVRELETYLMRRAGRGEMSVDGVRDVVFHVGDTEFARRHGLDASVMAEESWRIKSFGGSVVLVGGGVRGTLYAVYHFLEDFCGVRWWSETEEDVPTGPLALPRLDASGRPAFPYRDDYRSEFAREATPQFAVRRRLNRNGDVDIPLSLGGSFAFGPPYYCHTFNKYINWESLGKTRPELFSLVDGKRCGGQDYDEGGQLCLSNPEVYSVIRDGLVGYATNSVAEARERGLSCPVAFEVSMNDNRRYCQCEGCKAQMAEGGVTAQYLDFVNRLAADLRRVRPEAAVSTLAYYFTEEPPSNSVRAADNVIIKLCNTRSNLAAPFYEPGDNDIMRDLIGKWEKISKHLFVWDYDQTFTAATFGLPFPSEFHFADKFRFYREHHVDGIFWQQTLGSDEDIPEIKFYLKSRLFEDPDVDYPRLLEQTFCEYFGPKAGPLVFSARHRLVEAQARNHGRLSWFPQFNQWNFIREADLAFMNAQWDSAEKAVASEPVHLRRVTRARSGLRRLTERRTGALVRHLPKAPNDRPFWEIPPEKYVLNGKTNTVLVADAASPSGKAVELTAAVTDVDSLLVAYHDADEKSKGGASRSFSARLKAGAASVRYRWYELGAATLAENGYFYLTEGWLVHIQLPTPDFADKSYDVRVLARKTEDGTLRIAQFVLADRPDAAEGSVVHMFDRDVFVHEANYDLAKIPPYALEDPLTFADGHKVASAADWAKRRREILDLFAREMYGAEPPAPEAVVTELADEKVTVGGFAIRCQHRMWFRKDRTGPCVNWISWVPRFAKKPVPVILFLNYRGNHELVPDADIPVTDSWCRDGDEGGVVGHRVVKPQRGLLQNPDGRAVFPVGTILARGYAVMSACYAEVSPDPDILEKDPKFFQHPFAYTGVFDLWGRRDETRTDNTTALGAWGWALSRGLDLAARIPGVDARRSVVTGWSRLGKAALMAAARDERFAVCVPNQTGGGGCPLAKRDYGENVSTENREFVHWYCRAYNKYSEHPERSMPFDQHLFLACVAPRGLLVQGFDDPWYDTEGEFLAVRAASPVWAFLGRPGLPDVGWPADFDESAIGRDLGYVRRSQGHGISAYDWNWTMNFADRFFNEHTKGTKR